LSLSDIDALMEKGVNGIDLFINLSNANKELSKLKLNNLFLK
jgi:hypothetical protein